MQIYVNDLTNMQIIHKWPINMQMTCLICK